MLPRTLQKESVIIRDNHLVYRVQGVERTIDLRPHFPLEDVASFVGFRATVVVSNFHDMHVGDLAFLAMAIGMNNSAGAHCVHCFKGASQFNCELTPQDVRTKASLTTCLNEYHTNRLTDKRARNHFGVNTVGLLDIDPQRIIVPMLHCPMGLVDKVLIHFKSWTICHVENLPAEPSQVREAFRSAAANLLTATATETQARQLNEEAGKTPETKELLKQATAAKQVAKRNEVKARANFKEQGKQHNARLHSLSQAFDTIFCSHKITKEHCHGGKHNGVNCVKMMSKAEVLFTAFAAEIKLKKVPTVDDALIDFRCTQCGNLLGLMDGIWSSACGIEAGLLPTQLQLEHLEKTLSQAKALWLLMDVGTKQPKFHMTFDGHLLHQVRLCGGIADKSDESIELQHQVIMKLKDRFRRVASCQRRETCIRKELRRGKSPEIKAHVDFCGAAIKRKPTSQRTLDMTIQKQDQREAKRAKRETFVDG